MRVKTIVEHMQRLGLHGVEKLIPGLSTFWWLAV
jgi:hypothetical protein